MLNYKQDLELFVQGLNDGDIYTLIKIKRYLIKKYNETGYKQLLSKAAAWVRLQYGYYKPINEEIAPSPIHNKNYFGETI